MDTSYTRVIIELHSNYSNRNKAVIDHEKGQGNAEWIVLRRIYAQNGFQDMASQLAYDQYHSMRLQDTGVNDRSQCPTTNFMTVGYNSRLIA